ncbi:DnaJ C-terminal domain-containing protein [uncultured Brevundimonas sp.]|uniref:DnaJ C-terminal domain-containing protein n=1 Tax=uncultured Brevundimonas sp. TaxID=213418 RepID=UPI0026324EA9|nr:DnaJ C-terminal domain-containing protein [uncultured Brevundimonas sp.]
MAGDPYKELGVSRGATADEIKKAFRKLAKELHPDKNPGNTAADERFKRITAAFDLLGDKEKRAKYDRGEIDADGREQFRGFGGGPGGGATGSPFGHGGGQRGGFENIDLDELFGGMFGGGARSGGARGGFSPRGADVKATLEISLEDSISGATRRIQFSDGRTLDVAIPKGAADGQVIRLRGQGAPGPSGRSEAGDALITLKIAPHPVFQREGADLTMDLPVTLSDAVLGGKAPVRTPEGTVSMTIPPGSSSGKVLRLKGRGAFVGGKRGDLLARLMIQLPDEVDEGLKRLAQEMRDRGAYRPWRD